MKLPTYARNGDWLVHQHHGVGQLMGRETKNIGGGESDYFRLEINKGTIFVPEKKFNSKWFRPVASKSTLKEVEEALAQPPKKMPQSFLIRKSLINEVLVENSIVDIAETIRDLNARRKRRKTLSATEDSLLRKLQNRLLAEWTVASGLDEGEAEKMMVALLARKRKKKAV